MLWLLLFCVGHRTWEVIVGWDVNRFYETKKCWLAVFHLNWGKAQGRVVDYSYLILSEHSNLCFAVENEITKIYAAVNIL